MLLECSEIDGHPKAFLSSVGEVFAEFGPPIQDSGNVSYGVRIGEGRYFVKTAGDPGDPVPYLGHTERVTLLRNAVRLSRSCVNPALPRLYCVIESPIGPMLVYQWLEGELLYGPRSWREDPRSAHWRFRSLPSRRVEECLDVVYGLHLELARDGWVAVDFYDGCLIYDFASGRLGIVDLDNYRSGPFRNEMGRMFGSSRFMAPEQFASGSAIDQLTNVFVMGRAAVVFLADGVLTPDSFRGSPALYPVVAKACEPERTRRFGSMEEFCEAWFEARAISRQRGGRPFAY